jgi:hypothetical protein
MQSYSSIMTSRLVTEHAVIRATLRTPSVRKPFEELWAISSRILSK